MEESRIVEGRNAVLEAFRSGKTIDKLFVFGPFSLGLISVIPFVVAAIIMGTLALKKDNER